MSRRGEAGKAGKTQLAIAITGIAYSLAIPFLLLWIGISMSHAFGPTGVPFSQRVALFAFPVATFLLLGVSLRLLMRSPAPTSIAQWAGGAIALGIIEFVLILGSGLF